MIVFTLEKFVANSGTATQIGTTFTLARDDKFLDIVHTERIDQPNDFHKFIYEPMLVPDVNYYIKARRHFSESNLDHDTPSKIVRFDKVRSEAMIYNRDNIVETPWLDVNEKELMDPDSNEFTISGSEFKSNMSGHEYSHWIVTDGNDQVLFTSIEDRENKRSIRVTKTPIITSKTKLICYLIYGSGVGIESEVSKVEVELQKYNYEVVSDIENIPSGVAYDLTLRRLNSSAKMNISKIEVVKPDTTEVLYSVVNTDEQESLTFSLPWYLFRHNSMVQVIITALDVKDGVGHNRINLYTSSNTIRELEDPSYKYIGKFKTIGKTNEADYCDSVCSMELPEGYIPMPMNNSSQLLKFKFENDKLVNTGEALKGVSLLSINNSGTFIKYTENNLLVIDGWRDMGSDKEPVFLVYRHNTHSDTYDLLSMIEHPENDKNTAARNGSLAQLDESTFVYLPAFGSKLYKLDVISGKCTVLEELVSDKKGTEYYKAFLRLPNQRLVIQHGDESSMWKYEIMKMTFEKSISLDPNSFTKTEINSRFLPNGDNLIFKTKQNTTDTDPSLMVYSYRDHKYKTIDVTFEAGEFPNGSILLLNNDVILTKRKNNGPGSNDTYITYKYY